MEYKVLGNKAKGLAFVISAPAGTGKTTLVSMLTNEFPFVVGSISYTTRAPRPGEIDGIHYHYVTVEEFEQKIAEGDFLEYVTLYGNYYGTSRQAVEKELIQGRHVVLTIDTQGALQLKGKFPAIYIFLEPPSMEVLRLRLMGRKTETDEAVSERLEWAASEIMAAQHYDYIIVNNDLNTAYQVLRSILIAEEHKTSVL
jgi:guanylate kinase